MMYIDDHKAMYTSATLSLTLLYSVSVSVFVFLTHRIQPKATPFQVPQVRQVNRNELLVDGLRVWIRAKEMMLL